MRIVEPGHVYDLHSLDGDGTPVRLVFVNREAGTEHSGTQCQNFPAASTRSAEKDTQRMTALPPNLRPGDKPQERTRET